MVEVAQPAPQTRTSNPKSVTGALTFALVGNSCAIVSYVSSPQENRACKASRTPAILSRAQLLISSDRWVAAQRPTDPRICSLPTSAPRDRHFLSARAPERRDLAFPDGAASLIRALFLRRFPTPSRAIQR